MKKKIPLYIQIIIGLVLGLAYSIFATIQGWIDFTQDWISPFGQIFINALKDKKDFILLYKKIYKLGYSRIFLETGLIFLDTVIKKKLINNLYLFKSKKNLRKIGKNNISPNFIKKIKFKPISINLNGDKLFIKEF